MSSREIKTGASELPEDDSMPVGNVNVPEQSGATTIPQSTTQPNVILRHNISDEELEMLNTSRRDGILEAIWGCAGAGIGLIVPALASINDSFWAEPKVPLNGLGLFQILICFGTLSVAASLYKFRANRATNAGDLVKEIRGRQRMS